MKLYPWTKKQLCCLAHWRQVAIFPKKAATWRRSCFAGSSPQNSPNFSKISTRSKKPNSKRKSWHCCKMNPTKLCGKKWWIWWRKFRGIWWTMKEIICGRNSWNFCSTWPVHLMRIIKKRLYCFLGKIFEFSRLFLFTFLTATAVFNAWWPYMLKMSSLWIYEFFNFLYSSVPTVFGNEQTQYVNVIKEMLMASLNDQGSYDVRFGAVKASVNYLLVHEKDNNILNHFKELLPPILTVSFTLQFFTTNVTNLNNRWLWNPSKKLMTILASKVSLI